MPHFWIKVPGNPKPPRTLRDNTRDSAKKHKARLLGDELFFEPGKKTVGYGTVEGDEHAVREMAEELNADYERVLTADEADLEENGDGDYDEAD